MPVLTVFSPLASLKINKNILVLVLRISLSLYTKTCSYFPWLTFVILELFSLQLSSITQSYPILCDPIDCSMPGFPVHHQLPELAQTHVHRVSDPSNHLILCGTLLLLPSIFPTIRVFSKKSALHIRWPKYWSFSFNISPSNEYSGLITYVYV